MEKICPTCGTTFKTKNRAQIRCSRVCEVHDRPKARKTEVPCVVCGKPVLRWPSDPDKTCGDECRRAWRRRARPQRHKRDARTCAHCGRSFTVHRASTRRFCSRACYARHLETQRGPAHPLWRGGRRAQRPRPELYTAEWKRRLRQRLLEESDYRCTICGERRPRLVLHHLRDPQDAPELALDPSNLQVVCQSCHTRLHNPVSRRWAKHRATPD